MKNVRLLALFLCVVLTLGLVGCNSKDDKKEEKKTENVKENKEDDTKKYVAFITDVGSIDDSSFNAGVWSGVKEFADEKGYKSDYYKSLEDSYEARADAIDKAAKEKADIIVCAGSLFENVIYDKQNEYKETEFLIIDGEPKNKEGNVKFNKNVHSILFKEEESGYLAGYVAVKEGYRKLGFLGGMDVKAVVYFGYGFVQGAEAAAKELKLKDVEVEYKYTGTFQPSEKIRDDVNKWYKDGTEIIFSCGGGILYSVIDAAGEKKDREIIGVDVDQANESEKIVYSAMKELKTSVYTALIDYSKDCIWPKDREGKSIKVGVKEKGVGLSATKDSWRIDKVSIADYNKMFEEIQKKDIKIETEKLPKLEYVKVNMHK